MEFTEQNFAELKELAIEALLEPIVFTNKFGQYLNVYELFYGVGIDSLKDIKNSLNRNIEKEKEDDWTSKDTSLLEKKKDLVNLIIGYKLNLIKESEKEHKKRKLQCELYNLKESLKSPEDKIKEIEEELNSLGDIQ